MNTHANIGRPRRNGTCGAGGCGDRAISRGFCGVHYARWRRHGDPLKVVSCQSRKGAPERFIQSLPRDESECIPWPFARGSNGYGAIFSKGKQTSASRRCCEVFHGPAPEGAEAAHHCGNGHLGCVNPSHLAWKSVPENTLDKFRHGTVRQGSRHHNAKLSEGDVLQIRQRLSSEAQVSLAAEFGVSKAVLNDIARGKTWRHIL